MHSPSIFNDLFSNVWSIFLVILFFGGSIFVHELGHFLAARRRGLKVERFSIGFGPKIFGWTKDGIDYRVSLLPLGGYVALPQLADLEAIEGKYDKNDLPPITYSDKFIVAVMGAVFNVIFAFFLATILWVVGIPSTEAEQTTTIGYVQKEIFIDEGEYAPGPAYKAGLRPGDKVLSVDGDAVHSFSDIQKLIITGSGRSSTGKPEAIFTIERNGQTITIPVHPRLALANLKSGDTMRIVGILPTHTIVVGGVMQDSPAEKAGLQVGDTILGANGQKLYSMNALSDILEADPHTPVSLLIERGKERMTLE
ncbi:MAG TPA: RIP metalloprotease RseP, partial [Opitutae bacterium]|nr:RIP metalloprotease RseP [Opitutae bacterium]